MGNAFFKCKFMKTIISKQKKNLVAIGLLIFVCEIMLGSSNTIIQSLGILILPMIIVYGVLLYKNEKENIKKS